VEEPILGSPSAIPRQAGSEEFIVVEAGTRLLGSPHPGAPVLDVVQTQIELPLLERLGPWVRVRYGSWRGWILPLGNEELPVSTQTLPEPGEERRLNRARELLGNAARTGNLGPYSLYTDLDDDELLERLAGVATHLTQSYGERYDLEVRRDGSEAVVLFADERDYRDFEAGERSIAGVHTQGFARQGLVVLFVGERDLIATLQALIHELVHVLNRRALGTQIPAWLEEGLAEDLGFSRIQADGRIVVGSLGGDNVPFSTSASRVGSPHAFEIGGPRGSLVALLIEWHEPTRSTLAVLVAMPWQEFVESEAGAIHYAESAFLVRYFLDGRRRSLREGFRRYLRSMAAGELNLGETVWTYLEIQPVDLEPAYYLWLRNQAQANGLPVPALGAGGTSRPEPDLRTDGHGETLQMSGDAQRDGPLGSPISLSERGRRRRTGRTLRSPVGAKRGRFRHLQRRSRLLVRRSG
jgi:hypothetical protein